MGFDRRWFIGAASAGLALALGIWANPAGAGLFDKLKGALGQDTQGSAGSTGTSSLSSDEISSGLLEALKVGAEKAVGRASAAGGFLENPKIHIPLPPAVEKVGGTLRAVGLGKQVDHFETTLNRGAEKAAAEAMPIFGDAIKQLSFQDVQRIWKGGDTAATQYFRDKTQSALFAAFLPVVHTATQEVGVTKAYDSLTGNPLVHLASGDQDLNLDNYVANKALDGLFTLLAEEEKQIRTDPVARTTDLLKKVFGQQ